MAEELQKITSTASINNFPTICNLESICTQIMRYSEGLNLENIHREELAILSATVLYSSICSGLKDVQKVQSLEKRLPLCLHMQMALSANNDFNNDYGILFDRLPQLFSGV